MHNPSELGRWSRGRRKSSPRRGRMSRRGARVGVGCFAWRPSSLRLWSGEENRSQAPVDRSFRTCDAGCGADRSPGGRRRSSQSSASAVRLAAGAEPSLLPVITSCLRALLACTPAVLCYERYECVERGLLKQIGTSSDIEPPGSELRQRQIARSRRVLNTVREEFTRSRARRPAIIVRRRRTRGITT